MKQLFCGKKTKAFLTNLALLLFSLLLCLLLLEGTARLMVAQNQANVFCGYQYDPNTGWALKPSLEKIHQTPEYSITIETNSRGQRSPETETESFQILALGDSFVFGQGVEQNQVFTARLSESLQEKGKSVSITNTGVPGYSTKQELSVLEQYLEKESPDLAILGFFAGNDVYGNLENEFRYQIENGCLKARPQPANDLKGFLRNNLKSYGFFAEKIRAVPILREMLMALGLMHEKRPPAHLLSLENPVPEPMEQAWKETEEQLERAQEIAQEHNLKIVVVTIPSNFQVNDSLRAKALAAYGIPEKNFEYDYPETRLKKFLKDKPNLVPVTLVETFRESPQQPYFESDPHWNKEGHELAALALEKELLEKGLV